MPKHDKREPPNIRTHYVSRIPEDTDEYDHTGDFFARSETVANLKPHNFYDFIRDKDASMILFYNPVIPDCCFAKKHMAMAATYTGKANHGYGAVNCRTSERLCDQEGIEQHPTFKMYSKGHYVATIRDYLHFTSDVMASFVEKCPVLEEPVHDKRKCKK